MKLKTMLASSLTVSLIMTGLPEFPCRACVEVQLFRKVKQIVCVASFVQRVLPGPYFFLGEYR